MRVFWRWHLFAAYHCDDIETIKSDLRYQLKSSTIVSEVSLA